MLINIWTDSLNASGYGPSLIQENKDDLERTIYIVQYAIIRYFDQKLQKTQNFYFVTIFKVKLQMSSLISIFFRRRKRVPTSMIPDSKNY